jgi:hypothetical protein
MKCVAQMPKPVETADTASQTTRNCPAEPRAWRSRVIAAYEAIAQTTTASAASQRSWAVVMQE